MKRLPLDPSQEKLMHHLYYGEKFYFGRDKIWRLPEVQEAGISRRQVADWLALQQTAQMFKPTRASRDVQPTIATKPYGQIVVDLIDMSTMADKGFKWLFTGVDLFSKKAFAVPMKDKTEKTVIDAMRKMLKQFAKMPAVIRSDNGSEFISSGFQKLLADNGIKQVLSSAGKPQSNGQIERTNGILKRLFKMNYLYTGKIDWATDLDRYLDNYNNSYQRIIGMNPNEAEEAGADGDYEVVHDRIKQNVIKRHVIDTVKQVFVPRASHRSVQYSLEELDGRFYNNDLQKIAGVENPIHLPETYIISKIMRPATKDNAEGYIIRWKGYKPSDDTWEPRENLLIDVPKMLEKFDVEHKVVWSKPRGKAKFSWDE